MRAPFRLPVSVEQSRKCSRVVGLAQLGEGVPAALVFKVGKGRIPFHAGLGFGLKQSKELKFEKETVTKSGPWHGS
jgi:hypothetical protein